MVRYRLGPVHSTVTSIACIVCWLTWQSAEPTRRAARAGYFEQLKVPYWEWPTVAQGRGLGHRVAKLLFDAVP